MIATKVNERTWSCALNILEIRESSIKVSTNDPDTAPFFLPRKGYVKWAREPVEGEYINAVFGEFVYSKHRQLCGDEQYEEFKRKAKEPSDMAETKSVGNGALFK